MTPDPSEDPLRFVVGVTASGKSELGLELAERVGAEILSLDSMQVYRGMDVGTAKPSDAERARVPHHLIDLVGPEERYDLQRYLADFERVRASLARSGRRVLVVGGTGLYLQAVVHGLFQGPPIDAQLRARLEARAREEGLPALHAELARVDPGAAGRIHPNDRKRLLRALEVFEQTGRPLSAWQTQWGAPGEGRPRRIVAIGRPDSVARARIAVRTRAMLDAGWADEARGIREGPGFGPSAIQALGYREVLDWVDGRCTRAETEELIVRRTGQFARRQRTWLRRFPELRWHEPPGAGEGRVALEAVLADLGWGGPPSGS